MEKIQKKVKEFCKENKLDSSVEYRVLDTLSELGEVAKEVLKMSSYGRKPMKYRTELKNELGDVLFSLVTVANTFEIDLEDALNQSLEKYQTRLKKGSAGSEND